MAPALLACKERTGSPLTTTRSVGLACKKFASPLKAALLKLCAPLPLESTRLTFGVPLGGTGGGTLAFNSLLKRPTRTAGYAAGGEVRGAEGGGDVIGCW